MSRLKVDNIETRSGNNVAMDNALQLKSYTTAERDALTVSAGDMIYNTTTSKVEAYTGSAWTQLGGLDLKAIDYLIIAGGGGGATTSSYGGSGGGAGGYRTSYNSETSGGNASAETPHYISTGTNYVITVGAGGAITNDGNESQFGKVISVYGGRGTNHPGDRPRHGGNGGSGGGSTSGQAYGILGQGSDGGSSPQGGGGGAGAAGGVGQGYNVGGENGGVGGNGLASTITGSSVTRAGGGGASTLRTTSSGSAGTGGTGGGGNGSKNGTAGSGTANTGSGGGGSVGSSGVAGTGGSGFVALSYPSTLSITVGAGLTTGVSETTDGSRKYITFTGGTGNVSWS
jgi:hypothetical protein